MVFARIRAQVVLPTPRGPQNRKACANWPFLMAFFRVVVIWDWPTTVEKSWGLYFRALTMNLSISANLPQIHKSRRTLYKKLSMNHLYRSDPSEEGGAVGVSDGNTGFPDLYPAFFYRI